MIRSLIQKRFIIPLSVLLFIIISILFIRNIDPLNIRKHIYPGATSRYTPNIGNGSLIKLTEYKRIKYGYFAKNGEKLLVMFHGNADTILSFQKSGRRFYSMGYTILIVEYPGFGFASDYKTTEKNIYHDCQILIKYFQKKHGFTRENTHAFAYSLGTGVAVEMCKRKLISNMILVAAYTSIPEV